MLPAYEDRGLEMLMVSIDPSETEQSIEAFNNAAGIEEPLPTVLDSAEVIQEFGVSALETTIILDRDATVSDPDTLRAELESTL
ncbi:MAG: redoxin domain-containing protein [Actinomycetota bacterium]|nr:redoxin domain-containing protein [Actinomycetota bacterium]